MSGRPWLRASVLSVLVAGPGISMGAAQDLVVTNARILDGAGTRLERGTIVVRNGRTLWDAGVVYGFGTDTDYLPREGLKHELRALSLMFSSIDILELMGPNTAAFIEKSRDFGSLQAGKVADLVIVDGDPLDLIYNLLNVKVVVKGGTVVVDKRN